MDDVKLFVTFYVNCIAKQWLFYFLFVCFATLKVDVMDAIIGKKLKIFREANRFTQEQVAVFVGMERGTLSNYELGTKRGGNARVCGVE